MRKIVKPMILVLIILQILSISSSTFAVETGDNVLLYSKEKLDDIEMNYYGQDIVAYYTVYSKDGIEYPAYCVNYEYGGVTDNKSYNVQITEEYNNIDVWKAIINGYPFKSATELGCANDQEAYAATKQAVFCMLYNRDLKWYTYKGEAGKRTYEAMKKIVEIARSSNQTPTSTQIGINEEEWKIDEIDNNFLSKKITLDCETEISRFSVTLEGNIPDGTSIVDLKNNRLTEFKNCKEFKILVPLKSLKTKDEFIVNVQGKVNSYPMYYGKAPSTNMQSYVLTAGIVKQELSTKLVEYPENKTKIIIKKQGEGENVLQGVKFNILDANKNIIFENIKTNEYGIIEIDNMIPGIYYLQEVETVEGYELNDTIIEFSIGLDEEKEIVVQNNKIPEIPDEPEILQTPTAPEPPKLPRTGW